MEEYDQAIIPAPIINANDFITDSPNAYIAIIERKVANQVPSDLLIVCHKLDSNILAYNTLPFSSHSLCLMVFSLTLSKTMIVSLILYHIVVRIAMTNTVSTVTVWSIIIRIA